MAKHRRYRWKTRDERDAFVLGITAGMTAGGDLDVFIPAKDGPGEYFLAMVADRTGDDGDGGVTNMWREGYPTEPEYFAILDYPGTQD